ncbi:LysR family transcriptional regulator [Rhodococcus sp. NPDC058521]|uniref:LysR family transcriptional regulator n=1 Tax=Rhodococcus sp. NPDC058521 TaxID=3346536 RepID=UPI0036577F22
MDLIRHLNFFVAVAEEGHFGRAAERLGMTQPPLSQGMRRLEQKVGTDLVHRGHRGAVLTEAGRELLPRARLLVADAARFEDEARRVAGGSDSGIRLGVTDTVPDEAAMACVNALRHSVSGAVTAVSTTTDSTNRLVDSVAGGLLDLAVVDHPALLTGLECGPVLTLRRWLLAPADHPVVEAERPHLRMLRGLAFASRSRSDNPPAHDLLIDLLRTKGLDPEVRIAKNARDLLGRIAAGECFGVTAARPAAVPGVAWVDLLREELALRTRIVWRRDHEPAAAVRALDRVMLAANR